VLSTSQTAVALGISGVLSAISKNPFPGRGYRPHAALKALTFRGVGRI
jgi:hypothetical protein